MGAFEGFGEQLVQFDIGISGLESRVNKLTRERKITDANAKALVTGFIDAAIKAKKSPGKIYGMVTGFARWLHNGSHEIILQRIYRNMAETGEGIDVLQQAGDEQGIQIVAELAWEKHPTLTIDHYKGANRNELLRKIAEHNFNAKEIGRTKLCLTELKDIIGLRRHALARLEDHFDYAEGILKEHGTDDDVRAVVKFLQKRDRKSAYGLDPNDYVFAYDWAMRIKNPTAEDTAMIGKLKAVLIEKSPEKAISRFWKEDNTRVSDWPHPGRPMRICTDKEGVIAAGKRLLETDAPLDALGAFESVKYDGPEIIEAGIKVIKQYYEKDPNRYNVYEGHMDGMRQAAKKAIPAYLAAGGSILAVQCMIGSKTCGDDLNRRIGNELIRKDASDAYERFMAVKDKTPDDNARIAELRKKMVDTDRGTYLFEDHNDLEGMRMHLNAIRSKQPDGAYKIALKLKDAQLAGELRQEILNKMKPDYALSTFKEAKDEIGIQMVRDKIGQGIDPGIIDTLVERVR
jgi:hypothetical protein